jgi:hypothetical protein
MSLCTPLLTIYDETYANTQDLIAEDNLPLTPVPLEEIQAKIDAENVRPFLYDRPNLPFPSNDAHHLFDPKTSC